MPGSRLPLHTSAMLGALDAAEAFAAAWLRYAECAVEDHPKTPTRFNETLVAYKAFMDKLKELPRST